jgi:hypothetical protein
MESWKDQTDLFFELRDGAVTRGAIASLEACHEISALSPDMPSDRSVEANELIMAKVMGAYAGTYPCISWESRAASWKLQKCSHVPLQPWRRVEEAVALYHCFTVRIL